MSKYLPRVVYQMCVNGALIAGSYAKKLVGDDVKPNDFDLMVPSEKWHIVSLLIPEDAHLNKFGGWRFNAEWDGEEVEVDVWPDTVERYLSNCKTKHGGRVVLVDFISNRTYESGWIKEVDK